LNGVQKIKAQLQADAASDWLASLLPKANYPKYQQTNIDHRMVDAQMQALLHKKQI